MSYFNKEKGMAALIWTSIAVLVAFSAWFLHGIPVGKNVQVTELDRIIAFYCKAILSMSLAILYPLLLIAGIRRSPAQKHLLPGAGVISTCRRHVDELLKKGEKLTQAQLGFVGNLAHRNGLIFLGSMVLAGLIFSRL